MNIVMLGAPGAGKGTVATQIKEKYSLKHISTGDVFRENIKNNTEIGILAKKYIDSGEFVPDDVTIKMVIDRLNQNDCKNGFILDGFPRNINQAKCFDEELEKKSIKINFVIFVDASDKQILKRLAGRRVCEKCNAVYHTINFPTKIEGICDKCGGKVIKRKDDEDDIIIERLKTYHSQTSPLIEYYKKKNVLKTIPGFVDKLEDRYAMIDAIWKESIK